MYIFAKFEVHSKSFYAAGELTVQFQPQNKGPQGAQQDKLSTGIIVGRGRRRSTGISLLPYTGTLKLNYVTATREYA